jgi:hypothetical protein
VTAQTTTKPDGSFVFKNLSAGTYVLAAGPTSDPANATNTLTQVVQPSTQVVLAGPLLVSQ